MPKHVTPTAIDEEMAQRKESRESRQKKPSAFDEEKAEKRAEVRQKYAEISERLGEVSIGGCGDERRRYDRIREVIDEADDLATNNPQTPREMRMDAQICRTTAKKFDELLNQNVLNQTTTPFYISFAKKLSYKVDPGKWDRDNGKGKGKQRSASGGKVSNNNWVKYYKVTAKVFMRSPYWQNLGIYREKVTVKREFPTTTSSVTKKVRQQQQQSRNQASAVKKPAAAVTVPATRTREIKAGQSESDDVKDAAMKRRIKLVKKCLRRAFRENRNHPVHYLRFVTDPDSFEATVRNMFTVSFLLSRREVAMTFDCNDQPHIWLVEDDDERKNRPDSDLDVTRDSRDDILDVGSWIASIDMEIWKEMIDVYDILQPMIKEESDNGLDRQMQELPEVAT